MSSSIAIIVPFRDLYKVQRRKEHLDQFLPHMKSFLETQTNVSHFHIYIIDQFNKDGRKFNRGKLLNIGFNIACNDEKELGITYNSFIFHDVDLLPIGHEIAQYYNKIPTRPIHIGKCFTRYSNNPKYFGGIVSFNRNDFEKIDGFPNVYWGWGGEDDELFRRVKEANLTIEYPPKHLDGSIQDIEQMNLQEKLSSLRKNKHWKCNIKWEVSDDLHKHKRDNPKPRWWGLNNIEYDIIENKNNNWYSIITVDVLDNKNWDDTIKLLLCTK